MRGRGMPSLVGAAVSGTGCLACSGVPKKSPKLSLQIVSPPGGLCRSLPELQGREWPTHGS